MDPSITPQEWRWNLGGNKVEFVPFCMSTEIEREREITHRPTDVALNSPRPICS